MTPERWQRIKSIFETASGAASAERPLLLDRLCEGDRELRREVEQCFSDSGATLIHDVISSAASDAVGPAASPERFGHYQLVRLLGKGGMGVVYEAIRVNDFRKKVAIKIIQREFDSDFARQRFQQERQFLATLEHPYIARLLDGGTTPGGAPYLVMEYIEGEPITSYCARGSRLAQVLELFNQICGAVDYAHQKGIVHRDLKPGNILVTAEGIPKLLDFGIARSAERAPEAFPVTEPGMLIGSLQYMSPEQARGLPVDARSDVFSLGVVLYELVCGRRPFDDLVGIVQKEPPALGANLPPALEPVVLRALRKDPGERFSTARELLDELKRIHYALELEVLAPAPVELVRFELFGKLRISQADQTMGAINTNRLQSLLAYLVLHGDAQQSREQLAFLLWPESSESQARTNLRQLLHHLRRALPARCGPIDADNHSVRWNRSEACWIDVLEFDAALVRAAVAAKRSDAIAERAALEQAAGLYQDDLLRGLYDEWLEPKREHYRQQLAGALSRLAALFEEARDFPAAIRQVERLVAHDPLREAYHQSLIRLHAANQDRASALRAYHQCMRVLRRELGVEPGPATRTLFERILKSEAADAVPAGSPPTTTAASALPMIGRKQEWQRLMETWRSVSRGGIQLAVIAGEPGIGKSRLAEELYEWCGAEGCSVARTRCYAGQGQAAYTPIADWLRVAAVRTARSHLAQAQLAELARVLPEILEENPAMARPRPLTESWERLHFYESINAAFAKTAKPLLLLIDDLQWCDRDSFEWLHSLFRSPAATQILVLGTLRSEEAGRDHPCTQLVSALRQSGQVLELTLLPLDAQETMALAVQIAEREIGSSDLAQLFQSTKGHPLFVVESVRAGLGSSPAGRVQAVIAARLEQLPAQAFELAGFAATIGRAFSFELLAKATDWDEDSLSRALDELWQRRIIEGHGASEYDFTHDRLREVAYAALSLVRRRFLHRRVALSLEEVQAGELDSHGARLAAHYEAAGMAEPAIKHYRAAAKVAQQLYADTEAAGLLRRALALCSNFPEGVKRAELELELLVTLGPVLVTTQGYARDEVGDTYARALVLSRQLKERQRIFFVLSGAWVFHVVRGQLEKSRELGQEFLILAGQSGESALSMAGHFLVGSSLFHLGQLRASREHIEQSLSVHRGPSESVLALFAGPDVGVFSRSYLPHLLWLQGFPDQSAAEMQRAVTAAHQVEHPFSLAIALDYSAMLHVFRGERSLALVRAEEAVGVCRKHGFVYYGSIGEILAGWAEGSVARLRQGLDALKATGAEIRLPFYHGLLAEVYASGGQDGEALANISTAFAFQSKNGEDWSEAELHRIHGDLLLHGGNREQAEARYRKALEAARKIGARSLELRAAVRLGRLGSSSELQGAFAQFNEGLDSPDLVEARSLVTGRPPNAETAGFRTV